MDLNKYNNILASGGWYTNYCRGETASRRIREARARQIARAEKPQA